MKSWQKLNLPPLENNMTRTKAQRDLFLDIWADISRYCDNCMFNAKLCPNGCLTMDDWKTAIMSLDDPKNWPQVFEV